MRYLWARLAAVVVFGMAGVVTAGLLAQSSSGQPPCWAKHGQCPTTTTAPATTTAPTTTAASTCTTSAADQTSAILDLIASTPDGGTVTFAPGCYRVEGTIDLYTRHLTINGNGATFQSFNPPADQRAMWRFWDSTVTVTNMTIVGSYTHGGVLDQTLQHAHGLDFRNTAATVSNVQMSDLAGDCVYYGLGSSGTTSDSSCSRVGRNGVSVVSASNVLVQRMHVDTVGFDAFDVEPNTGTGVGSNNIRFDSNTVGAGIYLSVFAIVPNEPLSNLTFSNNAAETMKVDTATRSFRPQTVTVTGNTSSTPGHLQFDSIDHLTVSGNTNVSVSVTNCT